MYIYILFFQIILGQRDRFSFHILLLSVTRTVCGLLSSSSESLAGWWFVGRQVVSSFVSLPKGWTFKDFKRLNEIWLENPHRLNKNTHTHTCTSTHTQISDLSGPCWGLFGMNRLWNTWTEFTKYEKLPCKRPNTFCGECNFQNNQLHKICPFMGLEMKCVLKFRQPYSEIIARSLIIHQFPKF